MHVVKGQITNKKSLKIQYFLRPGNQILAYKTVLWVFVVRTLAMVFPYIGNVKYPHGRTDQQHRFLAKDLKRG